MDQDVTMNLMGVAVLWIFIITPLHTLLHEAGHALVARLFTHKPVVVYLFCYPRTKEQEQLIWRKEVYHETYDEEKMDMPLLRLGSMGKIVVYLPRTLPSWPFDVSTGLTAWAIHRKGRQEIWTLGAGPAMSLLQGIVGATLIVLCPWIFWCWLGWVITVHALLVVLYALIPRQPQEGSFGGNDGFRIREILKQ